MYERSRRTTPGRGLFETGPESLEAIKAYLECRSRGVEPISGLAEAWEGFYAFYDPRIRKFLGRWALSDADRSDCLQEVWHEVVAQLARFEHDPCARPPLDLADGAGP